MSMHHKDNTQNGFTLVELMIATSVFTVILLLLTFGLVQIGKVYYKGVSSSQAQAAARSVSDSVAQSIQFADGDITLPAGNYYCLGSKRISYAINVKSTANSHVLVVDSPPGGCTASLDLTAPLPIGAQELLADGMRLLQFDIKRIGNSSLYSVNVKIAKGPGDLIVDNNGKTADDGAPPFVPTDGHCKGGAGDQFCSVSQLYTEVQKRI